MPEYPSFDTIKGDVANKLSKSLPQDSSNMQETFTGTYKEFRRERLDEFILSSFFEKYCNFSLRYMNFVKKLINEKMYNDFRDQIKVAGLNIEPESIISASILTVLVFSVAAVPFYALKFTSFSFFVFASGLFISFVVYTYVDYMAEITKIAAQQESLLAILYMTIYMRVNPILENAMFFSTQHLSGPLGRDLKTVLWMLDMEKINSIEGGINFFVGLWIKRNPDFVKSMMTLYSVLAQTDKENQTRILDKSLSTILDATYEKMKIYAYNLKTPVTVLHTFGMMLPLIGLIAFPLMSIFMADSINVTHLFFGYIVVLPMILFFFTRRLIAKRPGAFSFPDLSRNPYVPPKGKFILKVKDTIYYIPIKMVAVTTGIVIMIPGLYHFIFKTIPSYLESKAAAAQGMTNVIPEGEYKMMAMFLTITIPVGLGIGIAIYHYMKSTQILQIRQDIVEIEEDLGDSLFQMSNQFTEEIPIEQAIENFVNQFEILNMKKKKIFDFFLAVRDRMQDEGVTFSQAIFDTKYGIIQRFPSVLLKEVAWIIVEGSKKGAKVLYNILTKISIYLDNVKKVRGLIYDLLNETVNSIKMQAKFLAPFIAGLVGSLTLIIVQTLYQISSQITQIMNALQLNTGGLDSASGDFFGDFINFAKITPPTIFQVLVGIYMVETVILLSILANGVENGFDKISRDGMIARNLLFAIIVFVIVTVVGVFALNNLVQQGISSTGFS
ncbi:hypothetical protein JW968_05125 [Candidatus Woesearchaeota archaeon]|nr:hypothetical protein [Candidatus Woesearchaeota archaeon]